MKEIIEIPEGWERKKITEVAVINMGQSPSSDNYNNKGKGIYLIQGNTDCKNRKTKPRVWTTEITKVCEPGDIIMTVRAPVGTISKCMHYACIGRGVCSIKFNNNNNYLYHYLIQSEKYWDKLSQGTTFEAISSNEIKEFKIIIPKLEQEQHKIDKILSTVDQNIEKTKQTIEKYKKIKNGLMDDLLTGKIRIKNGKLVKETEFKEVEDVGKIPKDWQAKKFNKISKVRQGLQIDIDNRYKKEGKNRYIYITVQYLKNTQDESNLFYIEDPKKSVICKETDILMTRTGNTGQVVTNVEGVFHNNFFLIDFDRKQVTKEYLYCYLNMYFIQDLISNYAGTTTIPDLKHGDFYKLPICFPPKEEQKRITNILTKQDCLIEKEEQYLEKLKKLKAGLMEDLLTGKVRVKFEN
ncbi:TPA: restriction endonuclease subunit S [Clostridium sporogenes]